jgi:class 3 adenylate cyclase
MPDESLQHEVETLRASLARAEDFRTELDRRIFHLKTLYDLSQEIHGSIDTETILKNFLLMSMGNFGAVAGFILLTNLTSLKIEHFNQVGIHEGDSDSFRGECQRLFDEKGFHQSIAEIRAKSDSEFSLSPIILTLPFVLDANTLALIGLGAKLSGDPYSQDDKELLYTLLNNVSVAVKNARSFEEIQRLNRNLEAKNIELSASLRKIEILEMVKANLCKFIPATVTRLIDKSPTGAIPELEDKDLSVLFLDIEGYTGLCERLGDTVVHDIIERHFSVFMDAIYKNNGDVNETAGDGLMVLFMDEDPKTNALEAINAGLAIREQATRIKEQFSQLDRPLDVNMGINSGRALVGAAKFESVTGSRWTYTARGTLTNVAARIGALGKRGSLLMSRETADRIRDHYLPTCKGKFKLKNVSEEVEVFEL